MFDFNKREYFIVFSGGMRYTVLQDGMRKNSLTVRHPRYVTSSIPARSNFTGIYVMQHRRLTREMRRELVKSLRTVCLLAMFSQDSTTVSNIQSALKSMSVMEPDLILGPILERAVPALESLVEVS